MFNQLNNKSTKLIGEQDKRQRREIELFLRDSKLLFEGVIGGKGRRVKGVTSRWEGRASGCSLNIVFFLNFFLFF